MNSISIRPHGENYTLSQEKAHDAEAACCVWGFLALDAAVCNVAVAKSLKEARIRRRVSSEERKNTRVHRLENMSGVWG